MFCFYQWLSLHLFWIIARHRLKFLFFLCVKCFCKKDASWIMQLMSVWSWIRKYVFFFYIVRDCFCLFNYHGGSFTVKDFFGKSETRNCLVLGEPNQILSLVLSYLYLVKKLHMYLLWNFLCMSAHTNESITLWSLDSAWQSAFTSQKEFQLVCQHTFVHENLTVRVKMPPGAAVFAGNTLC